MSSPKKVILLTTPTSATTSVSGILRELSPKSSKPCWVVDHYLAEGMKLDDVSKVKIPQGYDFYVFNQPHLFNFQQDLSDFKFLINLRDPRDLICNQYHWVFAHPVSQGTEAQMEIRRKKVREQGIAGFAKERDISFFYSSFFKLYETVPKEDICVISYAQLCLLSDQLIDTVASFIGSTSSADEIEELKKKEFPSALQDKPNWHYGQWVGSDLLPGRARIELDRQLFKELTERYKKILEFMQQVDLPELSGVYK